ncbi:MAG: copper resistance protein B [Sphingobium sp.]|nr:copper resistance protein B [Sphingobium sp.]
MMKKLLLLGGICSMLPATAFAQHQGHEMHDMHGMKNMDSMAEKDATEGDKTSKGDTPHAGHAMPAPQAAIAKAPPAPAPTEPKTPIPVLTDADRAAAFPQLSASHSHDMPMVTMVNIDRLEGWDDDGKLGLNWELNSWTGGDINRLWIRSSGEREGGKTSGNVELLYGRAKGAWWDIVGGIRQDFGPADQDQTWAALGIQGLAPYMFELSATAYVSTTGQFMAKAEAEYDLLLTNRLILQPVVEMTAYGKNDGARGQGSGLSSFETGARLRYRITRSIAPYVGFSYERALGNSADYRHLEGHNVSDSRIVFGINSWF